MSCADGCWYSRQCNYYHYDNEFGESWCNLTGKSCTNCRDIK